MRFVFWLVVLFVGLANLMHTMRPRYTLALLVGLLSTGVGVLIALLWHWLEKRK